MKLIFIYGPPATGKLTVATELAKITDLKVFHNHLTVDLLTSLFEFGKGDFFKLSRMFRLQMFETAAKEKLPGIIFTMCYAHPDDDDFVKTVIDTLNTYDATIHFVQITSSREELQKRVTNDSRKQYKKISDIQILDDFLADGDLFTPIPFVESLKIDNTSTSAKDVAKKIKEHYGL